MFNKKKLVVLGATAGVVVAGLAPTAGLATATKAGNHTVTSIELTVWEQPTKVYEGVLVKGQRFKVTKLSKSGKYAYGMAYGHVNKKGWVDAKSLKRS
jgi:cellulase/cellobiase CelA1